MPYKNREEQLLAQKNNYKKNKQKYFEQRKNRKRRNKKYAHSKKTECSVCGENDSCCLDFHHFDDKALSVSQMINDAVALERIQLEIDKCEVLCSNCHCKIHRPFEIKNDSDWLNESRKKKRQFFIEYLNDCKCEDCGESDNRCLEFHHVKEKRFNISYLLTSGHSLNYLIEELNRCVSVCSNCHRKRHWKSPTQIGIDMVDIV